MLVGTVCDYTQKLAYPVMLFLTAQFESGERMLYKFEYAELGEFWRVDPAQHRRLAPAAALRSSCLSFGAAAGSSSGTKQRPPKRSREMGGAQPSVDSKSAQKRIRKPGTLRFVHSDGSSAIRVLSLRPSPESPEMGGAQPSVDSKSAQKRIRKPVAWFAPERDGRNDKTRIAEDPSLRTKRKVPGTAY